MKRITIGLDIAISVFQVHSEDPSGKIVLQKRLRRSQVLAFFAGLEPALIGIEACGSALLQNDLSGRILDVNLENARRDIQPDRGSLHRDGLRRWSLLTTPAWHIRCRQGAVHPALRDPVRRPSAGPRRMAVGAG